MDIIEYKSQYTSFFANNSLSVKYKVTVKYCNMHTVLFLSE